MSDQHQEDPVVESYTPPFAKHKGLLILVISMGMMIIFGLVALGLSIMFIGTKGDDATVTAADAAMVAPIMTEQSGAPDGSKQSAILKRAILALPKGARMGHWQADGDYLYVGYALNDGKYILQYDINRDIISNIIEIQQ